MILNQNKRHINNDTCILLTFTHEQPMHTKPNIVSVSTVKKKSNRLPSLGFLR